jgi:hypothetical protein
LLSESKPVSNSVLAASSAPCAVDPASPLRRNEEDSFSGQVDFVVSLVTEETLVKADQIPSSAKGLIKQGSLVRKLSLHLRWW